MEFGIGKVVCVGLPRTGTTSIAVLGRILGYNPIHTNVAIAYQLSQGDITMLHGTDPYDFFSDEPYCVLWNTFYRIYPKAKFILTIRDMTSWIKSMKFMFREHQKNWDEDMKKFQLRMWKITPKFWEGDVDENFLRRWYLRHNGEVVSTIAEKQLLILPLEIQNKEKLKKVCNFLGKPLPEEGYPHTNKGGK